MPTGTPVRLYPWRVIGWTADAGLFAFIGGARDCIAAVGRGVEAIMDGIRSAPRRPRRGVELFLMPEEEFRAIVADAVDALPEPFAREVGRSVEIVVEPELSDEHLEGITVRSPSTGRVRPMTTAHTYPLGTLELYGLYRGRTLLAEAGPAPLVPDGRGGVHEPDVIFIFMGPCLRANPDEDALRFQVRNLVEHELAHHFGLTEAEVAAAHRRKKGGERKNPGY